MRAWTSALAVAMALAASETMAGAEPSGLPVLRVLVVNQGGVPRSVLECAQQEAARVFSGIGMSLAWTTVSPESAEPSPDGPPHIKINIVRDSRAKEAGRRLGAADKSADDQYLLAYAFYGRVEDLAQLNGADVGRMLGHVVVHEMGHLLLPYDSHSSTGIMRGEWDRAQFKEMSKGLLAFTAAQAELIRARVGAMLENSSRFAVGLTFIGGLADR